MSATSSAALTRDQWADAALAAIGRGGIAAVAVEPIAAELGVTKGSFYWHFTNRRELLDAALERWAQRATSEIIENLAVLEDPVDRLRSLFHFAFRDSKEDRIEDAILAAVADPAVAHMVARVNAQRLSFVVAIFRAIGFSPAAARHRARIAYAVLLGHRHLQQVETSRIGSTATRSFGDHLIATLVSDGSLAH